MRYTKSVQASWMRSGSAESSSGKIVRSSIISVCYTEHVSTILNFPSADILLRAIFLRYRFSLLLLRLPLHFQITKTLL